MNEQQLLEWGRTENGARKTDLADVSSAEDLDRAKQAARSRRLAVKLSRSQAAHAVKLAQMEAPS